MDYLDFVYLIVSIVGVCVFCKGIFGFCKWNFRKKNYHYADIEFSTYVKTVYLPNLNYETKYTL